MRRVNGWMSTTFWALPVTHFRNRALDVHQAPADVHQLAGHRATGRRARRTWGRAVCWAEAWEAGAIRFDIERGSAFREFKDGRREPLP